jgi:DNA-binding NtrC family response regulator
MTSSAENLDATFYCDSGKEAQPVILIVEDEERLRKGLQKSLSQERYRVLAAASGEEALALLEKQKVDLVVTDLVMPGMDGIKLLQRIKSAAPETLAAIMTAYGSAENMRKAEELGVKTFLAKPFDLEFLKFKINELLDRRPAVAGAPGASEQKSNHLVYSAGKALGGLALGLRRAFQCMEFREFVRNLGRLSGALENVRAQKSKRRKHK